MEAQRSVQSPGTLQLPPATYSTWLRSSSQARRPPCRAQGRPPVGWLPDAATWCRQLLEAARALLRPPRLWQPILVLQNSPKDWPGKRLDAEGPVKRFVGEVERLSIAVNINCERRSFHGVAMNHGFCIFGIPGHVLGGLAAVSARWHKGRRTRASSAACRHWKKLTPF